MQDFMFGNIKKQDASPEPYTVLNKEQASETMETGSRMMRDIEYFRSMYPARVKGLQLIVEEICDEMDFQGSPMYDEYPDRVTVEQLFRKVTEKIPAEEMDNTPQQAEPVAAEEVEIYEAARRPADRTGVVVTETCTPHMPYGPGCVIQTVTTVKEGYRLWEMEEAPAEPVRSSSVRGRKDQETYTTERLQGMEMRPWGPPPWGPPPPPPCPGCPPRPWGPPSWGPPPPPPCPGCPPRPWGPPTPRPWGPAGIDDIARLLLFGEMQKRRCNGRYCR